MKKFLIFAFLLILTVNVIVGQESAVSTEVPTVTQSPLQNGLDRVRQSIAKLEELSQQFRDRIQDEAKHIAQMIQSGNLGGSSSTPSTEVPMPSAPSTAAP